METLELSQQHWCHLDKQALLITKLQKALDHGGNTHSVEDVMQPQLVQMAKDMGCEFIEMSGRVGWSKVLPKYGWHKTGISHAMPIMEMNHE